MYVRLYNKFIPHPWPIAAIITDATTSKILHTEVKDLSSMHEQNLVFIEHVYRGHFLNFYTCKKYLVAGDL